MSISWTDRYVKHPSLAILRAARGVFHFMYSTTLYVGQWLLLLTWFWGMIAVFIYLEANK